MNLQTTIDLDLKSFFQWWGRELAFLIPQKLKQFVSDRAGSLVFSGADRGFNVSFYREITNKQPSISLTFEAADRAAYQNLKSQHADIEKADCILRLTDAQAINRIVYLPLAALENLQQVVRFELDRYTPFSAEQVYFSAVPMGKTEQGQLRVMLVLTPRVSLDEQLSQLLAWGVRPVRVDYQRLNDEFPHLTDQYNLLPDSYQIGSNKLARSVHWLLSGLSFLLLLAVLVYPVWQEKQAVDLLKGQIKALEKDTRVVDEQQLEIDALRDETQRLIAIKQETPELVAVLNELSHLLKDDTWLTHLQYSETHMQIQGQSPRASELIGLLEASPYFGKVSFVSPLTQDKATGMERFQISMDVSAVSQPADQTQQESDQPEEEDQGETDAETADPDTAEPDLPDPENANE